MILFTFFWCVIVSEEGCICKAASKFRKSQEAKTRQTSPACSSVRLIGELMYRKAVLVVQDEMYPCDFYPSDHMFMSPKE